jgi:hypothetical protein
VNGEGVIAVVNSSFKAHDRSRVWLVRALQADRDTSAQPVTSFGAGHRQRHVPAIEQKEDASSSVIQRSLPHVSAR